MPESQTTQPTLWRTCRVLANPTRIQILELLSREPALSVSEVAVRLKLPLSGASQALRSLESRGFLAVRRLNRRVEYRLGGLSYPDGSPTLLGALKPLLRQSPSARELIFHLATAFTHSSRIELYRLLHARPRDSLELAGAIRLSMRALLRHLRKLERRGFISSEGEKYAVVNHADLLGRVLAQLATRR